MLGKIFKNICIFVVGMIFGVLALVGGGYLLVSKTKVGTITDKVSGAERISGEEIRDMTILETVKKLSDSSTTIGQYTDYFPILDDAINNTVNGGEIGKYINVNVDKLKEYTFSNVSGAIGSSVSVVASFDSLGEAFGFTLPDLPMFKTVEEYVQITGDDFNIKNSFYEDKKENIYFMEGEEYFAAYSGEEKLAEAEGKHLYYRGVICSMPVTDALNVISTAFDLNNLTVADLDTKFGVKLLDGESGLLSKLVKEDDLISNLSGEIETRVDELNLRDDLSISIPTTGMISKIIPDGITVGELKTLDFDAKINALTVEDLGLNLEGLAAKVLKPSDTIGGLTDGTVDLNDRINNLKLSELGLNLEDGVISYVLQPDDTVALLTGTDGAKVMNDRINNITLNQFLGKDEEPGNKILNALLKKNIPVSGLSAAVSELTVSEVFTPQVFVEEPTPSDANKMRFTKNGNTYTQSASDTYEIYHDSSVWLFMLYTRSGSWGSFTYTEQDITVLEVADNIQGVTAKFKAATLQELWEIGFIENLPSDDAVRQKTINDALNFA